MSLSKIFNDFLAFKELQNISKELNEFRNEKYELDCIVTKRYKELSNIISTKKEFNDTLKYDIDKIVASDEEDIRIAKLNLIIAKEQQENKKLEIQSLEIDKGNLKAKLFSDFHF